MEELGIEYDNSLAQHDCLPYWYREGDSWTKVDYDKPAEEWLKPFVYGKETRNLVEIPCSWYMEDMMPMQFLQNVSNAVRIPSLIIGLKLTVRRLERLGGSSDSGIYVAGAFRILLREL